MKKQVSRLRHFDAFAGFGGFSLALEQAYDTFYPRPAGTQKQKVDPTSMGRPDGNEDGGVQADTAGTDETGQGLEPQAGQSVDATDGRDGQLSDDGADQGDFITVGFSEIDKYASAVLKYRWPTTKNYGDITKIDWALVPDFDLLTGGSPCQSFSIAGKRAGFDGKSGVFWEFVRCLKEKRPKYFIWENVKGVLSIDNGFTFGVILNALAEAGDYSIWYQILNAKDFGVPQNRERVFVVGFRNQPAPEIFFERKEPTEDTRTMGREISYTIDASYAKGTNTLLKSRRQVIKQLNNPTHSNNRVYGADGLSPTLNTMQGGLRQPFIAKTVRVGGQGSPHGCKQNWDSYEVDGLIRRLTPLECSRLMGLQDDHLKYGTNEKGERFEISDSQKYRMAGNGIVVNVAQKIIEELILPNEVVK